MPPKIAVSSALRDMAEQIKPLKDGEYLSMLLNKLYSSGNKDIGHRLFLRTAQDGSLLLGKRADVKSTVPLTDVTAVHHFMTVKLGISSNPTDGTISLSSAASVAPQAKVVGPKQITARMYFKNPAGFESLIKETIKRLALTPTEGKKVHAALLPTVFMVSNIKISLDCRGEVIGLIGINRDGVQGPGHSIMNESVASVHIPVDDY